MDTLFTTDLTYKGKLETFAVSFHEDRYIFQAINGSARFSIRREEDEWHTVEPIDDPLRNAATDKLESYLLSQH